MSEPAPTITVLDVRARTKPSSSIARFTLGYWVAKPQQESMLQLTNPIGQHLAFYVHDDEKKRVIAELRAALTAWESSP